MTLSCQKPVPCPISFHNNGSYTLTSTCHRANGQRMLVFLNDPNVSAHTLDRQNNRYRKWISCRSVGVRLHQFFPHVNRSLIWLHPPISLNLRGGEMYCGQSCLAGLEACVAVHRITRLCPLPLTPGLRRNNQIRSCFQSCDE